MAATTRRRQVPQLRQTAAPVRNTSRVAATGIGHDTAGDSSPADSVPGPEHQQVGGHRHRTRYGRRLSSGRQLGPERQHRTRHGRRLISGRRRPQSGTPAGWRPLALDTARQAPQPRQTRPRSETPAGWRKPAPGTTRQATHLRQTRPRQATAGASAPAERGRGPGHQQGGGHQHRTRQAPQLRLIASPVRNTGRVADTGTGHDTAGDLAPADSVPGPEHWHGRGYWHRTRHGWLLSSRSQRTQSATPAEWRPPAPDTTWQAPQLQQIASPVRNTSRVAATGTGHDTAGASAPADSIPDTEHQHRTRHGRQFISSRKRPGSEH